jgi:hypothetical protein
VPSHGLLKSLVEPKPSPSEPVKKQLMCFDKARTTTSPSEGVFIHGHFDNLLGSWWECETRVPKSTPVAGNLGEIGERYDGMGGGGNYGTEGGGSSRQQQFGGYIGNNFQRPPFSRPGQFGGESIPKHPEIWGDRANSTTKAEVNIDKAHDSSTTIRIRGEESVIESSIRVRAELMCRRVWLLAREEFQLDRTR